MRDSSESRLLATGCLRSSNTPTRFTCRRCLHRSTVRRHTRLPIVVGFGISRPAHLQALEGKADGVIVASALLDAMARAPDDPASQVSRFLRELRGRYDVVLKFVARNPGKAHKELVNAIPVWSGGSNVNPVFPPLGTFRSAHLKFFSTCHSCSLPARSLISK